MTHPVYIAPSRSYYHARVDCHRLKVSHSFTAVDPAQVEKRMPCTVCVPGAVKRKFVKRYCPQCNLSRVWPCAHNGGVLVEQVGTTTYYSALREPGDTFTRLIYVWPDRAHLYSKA